MKYSLCVIFQRDDVSDDDDDDDDDVEEVQDVDFQVNEEADVEQTSRIKSSDPGETPVQFLKQDAALSTII